MKTVVEGVGGIPRIATAMLFLMAAAPAAIAGGPPPEPDAPVPECGPAAAGEVLLPPPGACGAGLPWNCGMVPPGAGDPGCAGSAGLKFPCPTRIVPAAGDTADSAGTVSSGELRCFPMEVQHEQ